MPVLENPLRSYIVSTYDAKGYHISSFDVLASSHEGAEELAALELATRPVWRTVSYMIVEEAS